MASRTNNLTLVLGVADRNFAKGLKKAQSRLAAFSHGLNRAFGKKKQENVQGMQAGIIGLAASIERLNKAVAASPITGFSAKLKRTSRTLLEARKATQKLNRRMFRTRAAAAAASKGADKAALSMSRLRKSTARTAEAIRSTAVNLKFMIATMVGGAAAIGVVKFGADFEKRLGEIDTLLDANTVSIQRYQEQLIELSKATPKTLMDLSGALYQIISAGIPAVEGAGGAFDILTQSQKLAVGSISETKQSADLLITTMAAFKHENLGSAEAADKLTAIYQKGRTTIPQLSKAFGRAAPIAAQFGVSLDELGGLLISLTRAGLNTNEAVTGIRAMMSSLAKPTNKTRELLELLNIEFGENAIQTKGFSGVLEDLIAKTGGSVEVLSQLFPNIRALLPAVIAAGEGFGGFKANVDSVTNSIGASSEAVLKQQKRFFFAAELLKSNFQGVIQEIAAKTLPGLTIMLSRLSGFLEENREEIISFGTQAMKFFGMIGSVGGQVLFKSLKTIIEFLNSGFGKTVLLIGIIGKLTTVFFGMGKAAVFSMGRALSVFMPKTFTAAGGIAAGAFNGSFETGLMAKTGRFFSGAGRFITGILGFLGPLAIGGLIVKAIFDGFTAAADEETKQAGEHLARRMKEAVQRAVAEASAEFRKLQGVDAKDVKKTEDELERGTKHIDKGEQIGDARSHQEDFDRMLKIEIDKTRIKLQQDAEVAKGKALNAKDLADVENKLQEQNQKIRNKVLDRFVAKHMEIADARSESSKAQRAQFLEDRAEELEALEEQLKKAKEKRDSILSPESTKVSSAFVGLMTSREVDEYENLATRLKMLLAAESPEERSVAGDVIDAHIKKISELERNQKAYTEAIASTMRERSKMTDQQKKDSMAGLIQLQESEKAAIEAVAAAKLAFEAELPDMAPKFVEMAAKLGKTGGAARDALLEEMRTEFKGEFADIAEDLSNAFAATNIKIFDDKASGEVTRLEGKIKNLNAVVKAVKEDDYTGLFSSSYWQNLGDKVAGFARQIRNLSFVPNKLKAVGQVVAKEKAKEKTKDKRDEDNKPKGRKPPKANFDSLLNRLRKQRIRLEDRLQKMAIKSKKIVAETLGLEKQINATRKEREDTGEFTEANKNVLKKALELRIQAEKDLLKARQEAELKALDQKHKKENEQNEQLREKNRKDFENEKKKRLGLSSANAKIRKEIEGELKRIRLATESEVAQKSINSLIEKTKVSIEGITLTSKEVNDALDAARKRYNKEIVKPAGIRGLTGYRSVKTATRDFHKDKFDIGFNEFVEREGIIDRAKQEKAIGDLIKKQTDELERQGKLGVEQTKAREALVKKQGKVREQSELKFTKQRESLDKSFFQRSKKRFDQETKDRLNHKKKELKAILSELAVREKLTESSRKEIFQSDESMHVAQRLKDVEERIAEIRKSGIKNLEEQNRLRRERVQLEERSHTLALAMEFASKSMGKPSKGTSLFEVLPDLLHDASVRIASLDDESILSKIPVLSTGIKELANQFRSSPGRASVNALVGEEFVKASAFSEVNRAEIDALSKDPEMKKMLERIGVSTDPKVLASFARRKATGSMVDMGAGNELEMAILGAIDKGINIGGAQIGTKSLVDALDTAIPGIGDAIQDAMQELYDSDLHMKLFEDMSGASAEFAQGNVGALFDVATGFAQKVSDKMTSMLSGAARGLGNMIGTSVGKFAGETFSKTVGPILTATIKMIADNVLAPIAGALGASFGIMTGGISDAFTGVSSEDRLFSVRAEQRDDAKRDLTSRTGEIRGAASDRIAELDAQIASASDSQQREDLILQRREVLSNMEEQLLEARTSFAESERQRVEEHRRNNPMRLIDDAFSRALEMADKVAVDVPVLAVKVIDGLITNLPTLFEKIANGLADTVSSISQKLPTLMLTIVSGLIDAIPKLASALTEMIPALVDGLLKALIEMLSRLGEIVGPLVDGAMTALVESLILIVDQLPEIAVALVKGIVQATAVLAKQAPRIISAFIAAVPAITFALISAVPEIIAEVIKGIPEIIKGFGTGLKQAAIDFGRMVARAFKNFVNVGGNETGAKVGGGLGLLAGIGTAAVIGATGPVGLALGALGGGALGALSGSFFHDGGIVGKGQRSPATAAAMRRLGAAQYATGGMVERMSQSLSANPLASMKRSIDDVPAVLQAGEAVLNRQATAVLGEDTINQLNAGGLVQAGDTSVTLNIQPDPSGVRSAAAALLPMLIGGVNAEVTRPGSTIRNAIQSSSGRPIGSMSVPVSKRSRS